MDKIQSVKRNQIDFRSVKGKLCNSKLVKGYRMILQSKLTKKFTR